MDDCGCCSGKQQGQVAATSFVGEKRSALVALEDGRLCGHGGDFLDSIS